MIKRILIPLDLSRYTDASVATACALARANHAELEGAVIGSTATDADSMENLRKAVFASFLETCGQQKIAHHTSQRNGLHSANILSEARCFDLIVMGLRTHYALADPDLEGNTLTQLLSATSTPILAVPPSGPIAFERVLITYDGSLPAARALREFTRVTHELDDPDVTIACSDPSREKADSLAAEATAYLKAYSYGRIETATTTENIRAFVVDNDLDHSDLIVAGFHSRTMVRDFFIGSFTKSLIEQGQTALLLAH